MKNHNQQFEDAKEDAFKTMQVIFVFIAIGMIAFMFQLYRASFNFMAMAAGTTIYLFIKLNIFIMANQAAIQAKLDEVLAGIGTISTNQAEIADDLSEALAEVTAKITELTDAINNGEVGEALTAKADEVQAAVNVAVDASNAIKAQAQALADIVPNEPPVEPPVEG